MIEYNSKISNNIRFGLQQFVIQFLTFHEHLVYFIREEPEKI